MLPRAGLLRRLRRLTGNYSGANGDERDVPDFYGDYAGRRGKPLAITETAALINTAVVGDSELAIKQGWWRQVFDAGVPASYPLIKMVNWFEWRKHEVEVGAVVDWRLTAAPTILDPFLADLPRQLHLFASDVHPRLHLPAIPRGVAMSQR